MSPVGHGLSGAAERMAYRYLDSRGQGPPSGLGGYPAPRRSRGGPGRVVRRVLLIGLLIVIPLLVVAALGLTLLVAWLFGNTDATLTWISDVANRAAQISSTLQGIFGGGEGGAGG